MNKYPVRDDTKVGDFFHRLDKEIEDLKDKHDNQTNERLLEEHVLPDILRYVEELAANNSLMVHYKDYKQMIKLGNHYVYLTGYQWKGSSYWEYPFIREINMYADLLRSRTNTVNDPALLKLCREKIGYNRRKTTKVFLLNFPEFKPYVDLKCTIPSITPGNWYRSKFLEGLTRDEIKEMQDELQSTLSLLLL